MPSGLAAMILQLSCRPMMRNVKILSIVSLGKEDPPFREVIPPMEARRMGRLLKRALWCSVKALEKAQVKCPDAIITATDYGCMENSEFFLNGMLGFENAAMRPVHFMNSTHNTIGSVVAIKLGCHGYNTTYSHPGRSLLSALEDAAMQIGLGDIDTALVGWYDERTEKMDASGLPGYERAIAVVLCSD